MLVPRILSVFVPVYSRILSVLVTCLDSFLFLESQYGFIDVLCTLQKESENVGDVDEGYAKISYRKTLLQE